ncbi:MAG TPA: outer membrane beta-barrel protein [Vicinamibacterales bacterium]|jgi:opacity protein-like surface antigen|nr:outer membrane beta-barrel protein [Vicinamibacterales bacterium]
MGQIRQLVVGTFVFGLLISAAAPARADITAFLGVNTTPSTRQTRGIAAGVGLVIVGFEFEYAITNDDPSAGAPLLKTGMGSVYLQTPFAFHGVQPYFITGGGFYHEELGDHSDTSFGFNTGGGAKVALAGPLQLRFDYRIFRLGSGALNTSVHRFYAGVNLKL